MNAFVIFAWMFGDVSNEKLNVAGKMANQKITLFFNTIMFNQFYILK